MLISAQYRYILFVVIYATDASNNATVPSHTRAELIHMINKAHSVGYWGKRAQSPPAHCW
ncbi:uncharacterized protein BDCG_16067 [Blastomyces dermatitidis ER-3]|uniref:Uncharacterized protein n=1 Tax=Ajellomyces dermatitidis (strain ER-3 / ATCC MYA-2586) TaxID=559297 RepID=A0ABX2VPY8_AJEDR|nr:uncharacterized protein BDCG_16067 [Blastomyces dermatitidis ER-3]OAS99328.1 hypothetical protein BDCG_16067 [Blastomyces dermatitidis ER-3]